MISQKSRHFRIFMMHKVWWWRNITLFVKFFSGYYKILQKLPGFEIEKPPNFSIFWTGKNRKIIEKCIIAGRKRENCVVPQLCVVKMCNNFTISVFKPGISRNTPNNFFHFCVFSNTYFWLSRRTIFVKIPTTHAKHMHPWRLKILFQSY